MHSSLLLQENSGFINYTLSFLRTLPTVSLAEYKGVKSGLLFLSTGVGTVTIKISTIRNIGNIRTKKKTFSCIYIGSNYAF
jgi:hypothetical protein